MTTETLKQKIFSVIAETAETDMQVAENTALYEDLGFASIEVYVMLCDLEQAFGVKIPAKKLRNVHTAGDLCQLIIDELRK